MPRAVGPIFVAAILLLIGGAVVAGLRVGDDGEPTAQAPETDAPGGVDVTGSPSPFGDDPAMESPLPTLSPTAQESPTDATPSPTPTGDEPEADGGADDEPQPDDDGTGDDDGDDRDAGGDAEGDEPEPSETRSPSDDETVLAIDDMPDTGGGAATVGVAAILVGAGFARMRRR